MQSNKMFIRNYFLIKINNFKNLRKVIQFKNSHFLKRNVKLCNFDNLINSNLNYYLLEVWQFKNGLFI